MGARIVTALFRREVMAFLHRIYKWMSSLPLGKPARWARDWRFELYISCIALFIADANMRWSVCSRITAMDAMPSRGGTVAVNVDDTLARALWSASELNGEASLSGARGFSCP